MKVVELPPIAGPFIESLRSIGYSLESAVSDVIDNSLSAEASIIEIITSWKNGQPYLLIADNGHGMNQKELQEAMQLGAIGPSTHRDKSDLGRFGMGLKTASFSQCKKLNVFSRTKVDEPWSGMGWDLEIVEKENAWLAQVFTAQESKNQLNILSFPFDKGTAVVWDCFDKIIDMTATHAEKNYERAISKLKEHLSLIFHRFLLGENTPRKVTLKINNQAIKAKDPFALHPPLGSSGSILLTNEVIRLGCHNIVVKAYQIPHPNQMTHNFQQDVSPKGNHHTGQGIYIYRSGRLISAGGWMKLAKASDANKLARIHVEFENSSDDIWKIDVKKSRVELPSSLREQLRRIISVCSMKSSSTFTKRARMKSMDKSPVWDRYFDRGKERVLYQLNKKHPALSTILSELSQENRATLISLLEQGLPLAMIKNDVSATNITLGYVDSELNENAKKLAEKLHLSGFNKDIVRETMMGDGNIAVEEKAINKIIQDVWG